MSTECRKRSCDEGPVIETKRPRYTWYFKLESESSCSNSQEDAESVYSIQNHETDIARDTSDTDTKSLCTDSDLEVDLEYEVATDKEEDGNPLCASSSGTDDDLAAVGALTAAICDSSYEAWATGEPDSSSESSYALEEDTAVYRSDYWTCVQCKTQNSNPRFQFCDPCYQVRKSFFPPRPRKHRKQRANATALHHTPVKLESLQSCLIGLSQDSGLGSSQEFPSLQLEKILVPAHLTTNTSTDDIASASTSTATVVETSRKRKNSEESAANLKKTQVSVVEEKRTEEKDDNVSVVVETAQNVSEAPRNKELCILCNLKPKNSVFLHGRIGHMCSCYKCAMRTWGINKRCPMCNCRVRNVIKVFTA